MDVTNIEGLEMLRKPFSKSKISRLPKPTKQQTEQLKVDYKTGIRCQECGGWHHKDVQHLDYVGHATVTDRFLEVDPLWNWEPLATTPEGFPALDKEGGLWIRLTICGVTRLGYGDAQGKVGGDAMKEKIGDALRNASMRFGVALDLWAKIDLHQEDDIRATKVAKPKPNDTYQDDLRNAKTEQELHLIWQAIPKMYKVQSLIVLKDEMKAKLTPIERQIKEAKTKGELIELCNKLDEQQESEFSQVISEKLDEFLLNETNGDI